MFDRAELERVSRSLIEDLLLDREWQSESVLAHGRQFFPDLSVQPAALEGAAAEDQWGSPGYVTRPIPDDTSPQTRRYLGYVLLDLVTVDPDLDLELSLGRAVRFAGRIGLGPDFDKLARTELQLSAAAWIRVGR
jgi:hypothetical protein